MKATKENFLFLTFLPAPEIELDDTSLESCIFSVFSKRQLNLLFSILRKKKDNCFLNRMENQVTEQHLRNDDDKNLEENLLQHLEAFE